MAVKKRNPFYELMDSREHLLGRTTFTLTQEAYDALEDLVNNKGVHAKDIVNVFLREYEAASLENGEATCVDEILRMSRASLASQVKGEMKKTVSLIKDAINLLNQTAKNNGIPRDILFAHIILYSKKCIEEMLVEKKRRQDEALDLISPWLNQSKEIHRDLHSMLDGDDPLMLEFDNVCELIEENLADRFKRLPGTVGKRNVH